MKRKDYTLIASAIRKARDWYDREHVKARNAVNLTAQEVADALQADNPEFDRRKFLDACGIDREEAT